MTSQAHNRSPREPGAEFRARALVVDDEPAVLRMISRALRSVSMSGWLVESGTEAVHALKQSPNRFDFAILDLKLREQDGWQVLEQIRGCRPDLPVLLVSGMPPGEEALRRHARVRFLSMPFQLQDLLSEVEHLVEHEVPVDQHVADG